MGTNAILMSTVSVFFGYKVEKMNIYNAKTQISLFIKKNNCPKKSFIISLQVILNIKQLLVSNKNFNLFFLITYKLLIYRLLL